MIEKESNELQFSGTLTSGKLVQLDKELLYDEYTSERYWSMEYLVIEDSKKNKIDSTLLNQFVSIYAEQSDSLKEVRIYRKTQSIVPENRLRNRGALLYSKKCN